MPIHKILARSSNEGLKKVAETFGDDALILKTIKRNGRFELFVEITEESHATVFETESDPTPQAQMQTRDEPVETPSQELGKIGSDRHIQAQYREARIKMLSSIAEKADSGRIDLNDTDSSVNTTIQTTPRRPVLNEMTVKSLIESLELTPAISARLRGYKRIDEVTFNLASMLKIGDQIDHGIHAFVGPAGSGKTTSLIKLIVKHVMKHGENSCAIINCDRFRMGAKEQLTRLGELIGVDVLQVGHDLTLNKAIARVHKRQLVVIDMPGLGFESEALKQQLLELTSSHYDIHRLLVVPANLQYAAMQKARQIFASPRNTSCIASRLDETTSLGPMLSFLLHAQMELRYLADGPQIPEDFVQAEARQLVELALTLVDQNSTLGSLETAHSMGAGVYDGVSQKKSSAVQSHRVQTKQQAKMMEGFAKAPMSDLTHRERAKKTTHQGRSVQPRHTLSQDASQQQKVTDI